MIKQAIILSAGLGMRLRPITDNLPKVMVPIANKPLLEHHIEQLKKCGVSEIFINLHYLPEKIKEYFGNGEKWGVTIKYNFENSPLGTAGGIKGFEENLDESFFVIYGDVFSLVNYRKFSETFDEKEGAVGMEIIGSTDHPRDSDLAEVADDLKFLKIYCKPHKELPKKYFSMKAIFIFRKEVLNFIPRNSYYEIDHQLIPDLIAANKKIYGYQCQDYLKDIGTLDRYEEVKRKIEN
jgi:mannose-1-phosphate guanylyltransferase/phosphomannomutase